MLLDQPWRRVKDPVAIPEPLDAAALHAVAPVDFARLVRDHLVPRQPAGEERARWDRLWENLFGRDDDLAHRVFDVLEEFLDATDDALRSGHLDEHGRRRAEKFAQNCSNAWSRLQGDDSKPLGWAGAAAGGFNPVARNVIAQLVDAIAEHRAMVGSAAARAQDSRLWAVLEKVDLDPERRRRR